MTYILSCYEVVVVDTVNHRVVGTQMVLDAPGAVKQARGTTVTAVTQGQTHYSGLGMFYTGITLECAFFIKYLNQILTIFFYLKLVESTFHYNRILL